MRTTPGEQIGKLAASLIDLIEQHYGADAAVGAVAMVVDVIAGDENTIVNPIIVACSDPRKWVTAALLEEGLDEAKTHNAARIDEAAEHDSED